MDNRPQPAPPCLALFDLDGTLTWHDTFVPFRAGYALHHRARLSKLWRLPAPLAGYLAFNRDRGLLKSRLLSIVMGGERRAAIDEWADRFVATLEGRGIFRPAALAVLEQHRAAHHTLVLLSASPDLYVPRIGRMLGFERTLCTEIRWRQDAHDGERLDGGLVTANRRGEEKSRCLGWLRTQYPGVPIVAYGNSTSDLPHLRQADRALLVNGNRSARRAAAEGGIEVAEWS